MATMQRTGKLFSVLTIIYLSSWKGAVVQAFAPSNAVSTAPFYNAMNTDTCLFAGMGKTVKKGKKSSGSNATPFDAAASLLKMEKRYMEISAKSAKVLNKSDDEISDNDMMLSEFVIAARAARSSTASADLTAVADWVPVAQLCVARRMVDMETSQGPKDKVIQAAVSYYCREISQAATFGSSKFRAVPRQEMLYSVESTDSFHKYVKDAINGKKADNSDSMTKAEARKVLNLEEGASYDKAEIKQSYRKLSFSLHPDRFVGVERSEDEIARANDEFARVKAAFDALSSGINDGKASWYESLGGKERTDFLGPIDLLPMNDAKTLLGAWSQDSAVVGLDPELVQMFVIRNQNAYVSA